MIEGQCADCRRADSDLTQIERPIVSIFRRTLGTELVCLCRACLRTTKVYFDRNGFLKRNLVKRNGAHTYTIEDDLRPHD